MRSAWDDDDARAAIERWGSGKHTNGDIALRVYTARLIGRGGTGQASTTCMMP